MFTIELEHSNDQEYSNKIYVSLKELVLGRYNGSRSDEKMSCCTFVLRLSSNDGLLFDSKES